MSRNLNNMPKSKRKDVPPVRGRGHGPNRGRGFEKPKDFKNTLHRLLKYFSSFKAVLIIITISVVLITILGLSTNVIVTKVIYESFGKYVNNGWDIEPSKAKFWAGFASLGAILLLNLAFNLISNLLTNILAVKFVRKMRTDLFAQIVRLPIRYTDTHEHGDLMSRMTNDVANVSDTISSSLPSIVQGAIQIIGSLSIMLFFSPLLTLVCFITLLLTLIISKIISKTIHPLFKKQQVLLGNLNTQTEEMVSGIKTVAAYNHQDEAIEEFNMYSDQLMKTSNKANIISTSMGPIMNTIGNINNFLICFFGAFFVVKGIGGSIIGQPLVATTLVTFIMVSKQFSQPIAQIADMYASILSAVSGAERVFEVLDADIEDFSSKKELGEIDGTIDFDHIKFGYNEDKIVIKDFTLDVRAGHKIALVGATGSGKTTIVNLLMRFYDINSGKISVDDTDIMDVSKKELRKNIGIVLQDAVLFEDTIENNIKYGREDATDEDVQRAIDMANCRKFIDRLPHKDQTVLTEGATNISQGQRQLLTIARAILADPKILILDEATSSVDTRTEKKIQDAMVNLMENRTSIIIAHRLSTIQDADLIVVMDQGQVVEMGNHESLIKKDGVYNKLYQTQFKGLSI